MRLTALSVCKPRLDNNHLGNQRVGKFAPRLQLGSTQYTLDDLAPGFAERAEAAKSINIRFIHVSKVRCVAVSSSSRPSSQCEWRFES